MSNNEISKLIEALRAARDVADNENGAEMLCFLIEQALEEAVSEAKRRGEPVPLSVDSGIQ
ncbi:hypothetical protein ASE04_27345 [Rhizobium sp. Root708]|uniref:hypothetical protein n=1 Tax=Rhizobium sp. Root708 TaxID=1736592 RepID=UPI0006F53645|nr:hypothetical protein [Rhizobium sp. Root708]KRB59112.1 hypothetical protein ASE04_27345 [Rhizobium sp. Root708]